MSGADELREVGSIDIDIAAEGDLDRFTVHVRAPQHEGRSAGTAEGKDVEDDIAVAKPDGLARDVALDAPSGARHATIRTVVKLVGIAAARLPVEMIADGAAGCAFQRLADVTVFVGLQSAEDAGGHVLIDQEPGIAHRREERWRGRRRQAGPPPIPTTGPEDGRAAENQGDPTGYKRRRPRGRGGRDSGDADRRSGIFDDLLPTFAQGRGQADTAEQNGQHHIARGVVEIFDSLVAAADAGQGEHEHAHLVAGHGHDKSHHQQTDPAPRTDAREFAGRETDHERGLQGTESAARFFHPDCAIGQGDRRAGRGGGVTEQMQQTDRPLRDHGHERIRHRALDKRGPGNAHQHEECGDEE